MIKLKILFFLMAGFTMSTFAQTSAAGRVSDSTSKPIIRICGPSRSSIISKPLLYVINGMKTLNHQSLATLNIKDVEKIEVIKADKATAIYDTAAANGAILIEVKGKYKPVSLEKILRKNKINKEDYNLPIFLNNDRLLNRENLFLINDRISSVKLMNKATDKIMDERYILILIKPE